MVNLRFARFDPGVFLGWMDPIGFNYDTQLLPGLRRCITGLSVRRSERSEVIWLHTLITNHHWWSELCQVLVQLVVTQVTTEEIHSRSKVQWLWIQLFLPALKPDWTKMSLSCSFSTVGVCSWLSAMLIEHEEETVDFLYVFTQCRLLRLWTGKHTRHPRHFFYRFVKSQNL